MFVDMNSQVPYESSSQTFDLFYANRLEQLQELKFCKAPWANVRSPSCPESHWGVVDSMLGIFLGAQMFPSLTSGLLKG